MAFKGFADKENSGFLKKRLKFKGELHEKGSTTPFFTLYAQLNTLQICHFFGNGKPQASSRNFCVPGDVCAIKPIKNVQKVFRGDALSSISKRKRSGRFVPGYAQRCTF
jgi:hypothetical protein